MAAAVAATATNKTGASRRPVQTRRARQLRQHLAAFFKKGRGARPAGALSSAFAGRGAVKLHQTCVKEKK
jgi:hypothetical protein